MIVLTSYKEIESMDLVSKRRQGKWETQNLKAKNKDERVNAKWKNLGTAKEKQSIFLSLWPFALLVI